MKLISSILKTFVLLAVLGVAAYAFLYAFPFFKRIVPCAEPIPYALGTFDTQFNISRSYFLSALAEAEAIWEKPYGKNLFVFEQENDASRTLKVNLIYDYRQQATNKLKSLGIVVEDNKASYDSLKSKYTELKREYETEKSALNARVEAFNQRKKDYEAQVKFSNAKGGATPLAYKKLEAERLALNSEADKLRVEEGRVNGMVEEINALVVTLNRLITTLNLVVDKYNTTNEARGESFEEGVYYTDGTKSEIDIYEFENRDKLVRVLAHELGHALNLDHVEDPKAIMYRLNQGNNKVPTATDLSELKTKCEKS